MFNLKLDQKDKFEIGTYANFVGVFFLLALPMILKFHNFFIESIWFKIAGIFFLFLAGVFYFFSSDFFKHQLIVIGINFLTFATFQYLTSISILSGHTAALLATILISIGIWLSSRQK